MLELLKELWATFVALVEAYPPLLGLGIVVLAGCGVPASPLLILCGAVWGSFLAPVWVVAFGVGSLYLASIWPYLICSKLPDTWLARIPFVNPVELRRRFLSKSENVWTFLFILRFTPGIPFGLHNVASGVLKVPLKPYLIMSFLSCLTAGVLMILLGDAIVSGQASLVIGVVVLIVVVSFVVRQATSKKSQISNPESQKVEM
ncbi:MAG: VTT domain-containing protein [Opitutales bacterium]